MTKSKPVWLPHPRTVNLSGDQVNVDAARNNVHASIDPTRVKQPQGYMLHIDGKGSSLVAHDPAGLFYGRQTLAQWCAQADEGRVHHVAIEDWPAYPVRGVMLDISRDRVLRMEELYALVDKLASWKINQFVLYIEHTFAYTRHREVWEGASPMTAGEIRALDAYCRERFIDLVPFQNAFGHMHRWLKHDRYRPLAECPEGWPTHWAMHDDEPFSICPTDPAARALIEELLDEMMPNFSSSYFMVGCDETFDLGKGRSREVCEERGVGRVYLEFIQWLHEQVSRRGRTMMFFGDIIIHYPDLIPELPRDAVVMDWGYGVDYPFDEHCARYAATGIPFLVLPSTSTYSSVAGRTARAVGNINNASVHGLKHGARGLLTTHWGDLGTWHPPAVDWLGFAWTAAKSWAPEVQCEEDLPRVLDVHVFEDEAGRMGRLAHDLGNVFLPTHGPDLSSNLYQFFLRPHLALGEEKCPLETMTEERLRETLDEIDRAMAALPGARMRGARASLTKDEFSYAADMLRLSARAALAVREKGVSRLAALPASDRAPLRAELERLMGEHRRLWLQSSREGGLEESLFWYGRFRDALNVHDAPAE